MNTSSSNISEKIKSYLANRQILVPKDWLNACLEWISNENQVLHSLSSLQNLVYDQWLLTDLNNLETASLPNDIRNIKYTLNGIYCLQVNSVVDVSQSLYGQLQNVQKKDNSNSFISAETQTTQKPWELKPSRMLIMKMTDGVQNVFGMEYRNIDFLCTTMSPGCKVRIKGPILCRQGMLMLTSSNIELLGGEVEELFQLHAQEAVLCQRLGKPTPFNSQKQPPVHSSLLIDAELPDDLVSQLTDDAFTFGQESGYATATTDNVEASDVTSSSFSNQQVIDFEDISDVNIIQEVEKVEASQHNLDAFPPDPEIYSKSIPLSSSSNLMDKNENHVRSLSNTTPLSKIDDPFSTTILPPKQMKKSRQLSIEDSLKQTIKPLSTTLQRCADKPLFSPSNQSAFNSASPCKKIMKESKDDVLLSSASCVPNHNDSKIQSRNQGFQSLNTTSQFCHREEQDIVISQSTDFKDFSTYSSQYDSSTFMYLCQLDKHFLNQKAQRIVFEVKACIVTLLSKLQSEDDRGWCLKARICDGTAILDVQFSNSVLIKLIGYTPAQAAEMKKSSDLTSSSCLQTGMKRCRDAIIKMCKIMKIEIKSFSNNSLPIVHELTDTDSNYWKRLISTNN